MASRSIFFALFGPPSSLRANAQKEIRGYFQILLTIIIGYFCVVFCLHVKTSLPYKAICPEYSFIFMQIKLISHERLFIESRFETEVQGIFNLVQCHCSPVPDPLLFPVPWRGGTFVGWAQPLYRAWKGELKSCPKISAD